MSLRVAVAGAAGRMGQTVCAAVDGADDLVLAGRADPALGTALEAVLEDCDVVVDFTLPDVALANARAALAAGRHVVVGTTGFDVEAPAAPPPRPRRPTPSSRPTSRSARCS